MEEYKFLTEEEAQEAFKKYDYPKYDNIEKDITDYKNNNSQKSYVDIINEIVLWKVNRQADISENLIKRIANLDCTRESIRNGQTEDLRKVLTDLLNSPGVKIAMASTILKMFHPDVFPIIDKRAYHAFSIRKKRGNAEKILKDYYNVETAIKVYLDYIIDCYEYYEAVKGKTWENHDGKMEEVKFSAVDQILYQWDKERYDLDGNELKKKERK